jgi:hypothetical protein
MDTIDDLRKAGFESMPPDERLLDMMREELPESEFEKLLDWIEANPDSKGIGLWRQPTTGGFALTLFDRNGKGALWMFDPLAS